MILYQYILECKPIAAIKLTIVYKSALKVPLEYLRANQSRAVIKALSVFQIGAFTLSTAVHRGRCYI